jgi:tRNA(fMet)-specific endonuclease VapC
MTYLLDTNTCIFMMKQISSVIERFRYSQNKGIAISSITLAELEFGVFNSKAYERNRNALLAFSTLVEILLFDALASAEYGRVRATLEKAGTPIGALDTLIGAHAKSLNLTLVTNNIREFQRIEGLILEDWLAST